MSDLETPPTGWWWNPDVSPDDLGNMLAANKGRLVSLSVRAASPQRLAAVWVAKGADDADAGWSHDIDAAALGQTLATKNARLTCLAPFVSGSSVRFAAAWIPNKGANAVASWWNPDVDPAALGNMLKTNKGRLTNLASYVINGQRHHAAVWIDNTGANAEGYWWNPDVDEATLKTMLDNNTGRLTCLDPFMENGALKFGAVWVANTGAHAKTWYWYHGLGADVLGHKFDLFCAYPPEVKAYAVGSGIQLACILYEYPQPAVDAAALIDISGSAALVSQSNSMAPLDQNQSLSVTITNKTASTVNITGGLVMLDELGGFVDWSGSVYGNGALLGSPTLSIAPGGSKSVSGNFSWGMGVADFVLDLIAESGNQKQHLNKVFPVIRSGFPAPATISTPNPVFVGLWTDPGEIVPMWLDKEHLWISVAGQMVNTSQSTVRLAAWHMTLEVDGKTLIDQDLDFKFWWFDSTGTPQYYPVGADGACYLADLTAFFAYGFQLDGVAKDFKKGTLTLLANYKIDGVCGSYTYQSPVHFVPPVSIQSPVKGLAAKRFWNFGNGPNHNGVDAHEWPAERFAYDITMVDDTGSSHVSNDPAKMKDNTNFYAYGKPIFAVRGGKVAGADDTVPENDGTTAVPAAQASNNYVLIDHGDGTYAGYYHCRTSHNKVKAGDTVSVGQQIAEIGNAGGSSEPHVHFAYTVPNSVGRGSVVPTIFTDLKTKTNQAVTAVPASGQYVA